MLHGMLIDDYKEFFITDKPMKTDGEVTSSEEIGDEDSAQRSQVIIRGISGRELEKLKVCIYCSGIMSSELDSYKVDVCNLANQIYRISQFCTNS